MRVETGTVSDENFLLGNLIICYSGERIYKSNIYFYIIDCIQFLLHCIQLVDLIYIRHILKNLQILGR